ncbi:unnamed protein product [Ranitomeya imitator]|uniref:Uncharacterized protein n=1 Tax=Ranitomeya imitator TaxID=111125 RepID=A0ABN9L9G4_9NEOB|nr:unnamed protein product [Ranitomeya imitator]
MDVQELRLALEAAVCQGGSHTYFALMCLGPFEVGAKVFRHGNSYKIVDYRRTSSLPSGFQLNNKLVELLCIKYGNDLRRVDFDSFLSCLAHLVDVFDQCRKLDRNKDGVVTLVERQWLQMTRLQ